MFYRIFGKPGSGKTTYIFDRLSECVTNKKKAFLVVPEQSAVTVVTMKNLLTPLFGFDPKQHNVRTEILAGVTTFLTMAYMLALVPNILGVTGMDKGALFTTVIVSSVFATMVMAFYAKLPFVLGPGIGLSSFFA